uniref:Uncharacterized protein n=1 Tax=Globodera rostochiensis TaxID=31243 RepID=A0A914HLV6_GLORO
MYWSNGTCAGYWSLSDAGSRLYTANLIVDNSGDDLFPFVMLLNPGDKIEANFGPNFKFNITKTLACT